MLKEIISYLKKIDSLNNNFNHDDYYKLLHIAKNSQTIKLHFGCGPRVLKNWINIDLHYEPFEKYLKYYGNEFYSPNVRGSKKDFFSLDITKKGLPLADDVVDVVFHEDFIEHLNQKQQVIFLAETLRVMKKGAVHRINTPNLITSMKENSDFKLGMKGVYQDEWDKHIHKNVLTAKTLEDMAKMVGYSKVKFQKRNTSLAKIIPKEYRPDPKDRQESGNIFVDLIK